MGVESLIPNCYPRYKTCELYVSRMKNFISRIMFLKVAPMCKRCSRLWSP